MAITIRALAAIMLSGVGTRYLLALLFVLLIGLGLVMRLDINPLHGYVIGFLFWKLVDEDFRTMFIDLRWIALLAIASIFAMKDIPDAAVSAIVAMIVFDTLRLATCKFINMDKQGNDMDDSDTPIPSKKEITSSNGKRYGYIPFLIIAFLVYIWYVGLFHPDVPCYLEPISISFTAIRLIAFDNPVINIIILLLVTAANLILRLRVSLAENKGMAVIPGFGAGDPPVLAIIAVLLGFQETMLVFFISLLVSLPAAIIQERSRL